MKTYKTTIEKPRLEIRYDEYSDSPREWSNIGYLITNQRNYNSPDGDAHGLHTIMMETAEYAENTEHHMQLIKEKAGDILYIYPVNVYEHSCLVYRLGLASGWDCSNCGFYIVTRDSIKEVYGDEYTEEDDIIKTIEDELDIYTKWVNGNVYSFILYDGSGEVIGSCGGFYDIEDICEHLPDEFKGEDLDEYIK